MLLSGRRVSAAELRAAWLVQAVVSDRDLRQTVLMFAHELSRRELQAVVGMERIVRAASEGLDAALTVGLEVQARLLSSPAFADAARARLGG